MTKVLKGLCFAGLGAILACILTFIVVLSYSYRMPTGDLVIVAVSVGALLGLVAGAERYGGAWQSGGSSKVS
jgi:hypothetical protein